jgi:hypothetical protein
MQSLSAGIARQSFNTKFNHDCSVAWVAQITGDNIFPFQTKGIRISDGGHIILPEQDHPSVKR